MRLHLILSPGKKVVPYNYQRYLTGVFHRLVGINDVHDAVSLYSFSNLMGGESTPDGLLFPRGGRWFVSAHDSGLINALVNGMFQGNEFCFGMHIERIELEQNLELSEIERFLVASPIFVKRLVGEREHHFTYNEPETDGLMTETLRTKMRTAGLPDDPTLSIAFDRQYARPQTKLIQYGKIKNRANVCPIIIKGTPLTKQFAWNVGIGNSTGIGFGAITI